jgi:hypothetical protein
MYPFKPNLPHWPTARALLRNRSAAEAVGLMLCALLLTGCIASDRPRFISMSEAEIYAYNQERPLMKKVYCFEEDTTSSYIRRRQCMTVEEYVYRLERSVLALDVLQPTSGLGIFSSSRD